MRRTSSALQHRILSESSACPKGSKRDNMNHVQLTKVQHPQKFRSRLCARELMPGTNQNALLHNRNVRCSSLFEKWECVQRCRDCCGRTTFIFLASEMMDPISSEREIH